MSKLLRCGITILVVPFFLLSFTGCDSTGNNGEESDEPTSSLCDELSYFYADTSGSASQRSAYSTGSLWAKSDDPNPAKYIDILRDNPSSSALYVIHSDTLVAAYNPDLRLPLASTVKYVVAVEYARQAASGKIDPDSLVSIESVNRFWPDLGEVANRTHRRWIERAYKKNRVQGGKVTIREVARGMMDFSSNPATSYLMGLLKLEKINQTLDKIGLVDHDRLYHFISAYYISTEEDLTAEELRNLTAEERASEAAEIHEALSQDASCSYKASLQIPPVPAQRAWSDNLPGGTAQEYAQLVQQINDRNLLSGEAQDLLYEVVNAIVRTNSDNQEIYSYAGRKGGSTAWVFTEAAFFTKRNDEGTKTEYAFLFNGSQRAQDSLSTTFNDFRLGVIFHPSFRGAIAQEFGRSQ